MGNGMRGRSGICGRVFCFARRKRRRRLTREVVAPGLSVAGSGVDCWLVDVERRGGAMVGGGGGGGVLGERCVCTGAGAGAFAQYGDGADGGFSDSGNASVDAERECDVRGRGGGLFTSWLRLGWDYWRLRLLRGAGRHCLRALRRVCRLGRKTKVCCSAGFWC